MLVCHVETPWQVTVTCPNSLKKATYYFDQYFSAVLFAKHWGIWAMLQKV